MPKRVQSKGSSVSARHAAIACAIAFAAFSPTSVQAKTGDPIMDSDHIKHGDSGLVSSDQMLELGTPTSSALRLEGEQSMRFNNIDRAIMVLKKSVEISPTDMDGRILYAQALEKKLVKQKDRDPVLFNFVVKQWLYVAKKAEFMDQALQGRTHLVDLTGSKPGKWEPEGHYLSRVLVSEDGNKDSASNKVATKKTDSTQ